MIKRDFHGWLLDDAIQEIHNIVGDVRNGSKTEHAEFITGNGVIKSDIISLLNSEYGIKTNAQLGNSGVLVATIE